MPEGIGFDKEAEEAEDDGEQAEKEWKPPNRRRGSNNGEKYNAVPIPGCLVLADKDAQEKMRRRGEKRMNRAADSSVGFNELKDLMGRKKRKNTEPDTAACRAIRLTDRSLDLATVNERLRDLFAGSDSAVVPLTTPDKSMAYKGAFTFHGVAHQVHVTITSEASKSSKKSDFVMVRVKLLGSWSKWFDPLVEKFRQDILRTNRAWRRRAKSQRSKKVAAAAGEDAAEGAAAKKTSGDGHPPQREQSDSTEPVAADAGGEPVPMASLVPRCLRRNVPDKIKCAVAPTATRRIRSDDAVIVTGLTSATSAKYNGCRGRVLAFIAKTKRFRVHLKDPETGADKKLMLLPHHLTLAPSSS